MGTLHILHLEDDAFDADLVHREVARLLHRPSQASEPGQAGDPAQAGLTDGPSPMTDPVWVNAASAEEFLEAVEHSQFDAILSDSRVPGMDGLQAMQLARARFPSIPFVFVSGNSDPRWAEHCLEAGATDYVAKDQLWRLPSALKRLELARETERLARLSRAHTLLVEVVKQLSLARSVDQIVEIVRRSARQLTGADGASVVLREGEQCHYVDEDAIGPLWKGCRFPLGSCISGWAMLNKQAAVVPDIRLDDRIPQDAYRPTFVHSLVMVPIRAESPIGAIGNYWAAAHQASTDEVALLQALADSTALAFENVAAYQHLERRVEARTAELQEANKALEAFSYSVSHDLRAPLRAVQGYSDLLLDELRPPLEGQALGFAQNIRNAAQRMSTLIEDMLSLARVSRSEVRRRPVYIGRMARDILATLQTTTPHRQVRVEVDTSLMALGDSALLRLALENLLSNAWKFTSKREDAHIAFLAEIQADGQPRFCVRDNGAGFDMAYLPQLFEPFRRLHREADFPGTGVGLAIVQRVLHKHGGEVWAWAARGEGASFYFTLPAPATPAGA